jgi:hypothetical protein
VHEQEPLPGRTLLGHRTIHVLDASKWHAVLHEVCAGLYFNSKTTIYEMFLSFGFGFARGKAARKFPRPEGLVYKKSTDKKTAALLYSATLVFGAETLQKNLKRYTNAHAGKRPCIGLNLLLEAAREKHFHFL